jgi:hypothetical protein
MKGAGRDLQLQAAAELLNYEGVELLELGGSVCVKGGQEAAAADTRDHAHMSEQILIVESPQASETKARRPEAPAG